MIKNYNPYIITTNTRIEDYVKHNNNNNNNNTNNNNSIDHDDEFNIKPRKRRLNKRKNNVNEIIKKK